eukprot:14906373-Heterocapsa_arctica.AAC.1
METGRALLLTWSKWMTISLANGNAPGRASRKRRRRRSASTRWSRISLSASPKMTLPAGSIGARGAAVDIARDILDTRVE